MSVLRETFYKNFSYLVLCIYFAVVVGGFLLTVILMSWFYVKMKKQKISNMLKLYQIMWIFSAGFAFLYFVLRCMEIFEVSGWFKVKMLKV